MSFADLGSKGNNGLAWITEPQSSISDASDLGTRIAQFGRSCSVLREKLNELKRRPQISSREKSMFENQLNETKKSENDLKASLEIQQRNLDSQTRTTELAQNRTKLAKLIKDFERVRTPLQAISAEFSNIKVSKDFPSSSASSSTNGYNPYQSHEAILVPSSNGAKVKNGTKQDILLMPAVVGMDVDELLIEERHRDIQKINQDLVLVNEMMTDMATIVKQQGVLIDEIASSAEQSHEKAQAGLEQVKQAAAYQQTCTVS